MVFSSSLFLADEDLEKALLLLLSKTVYADGKSSGDSMVARVLLRLTDVGCSGAASLELLLMSASALLGGITEPVSDSSATR